MRAGLLLSALSSACLAMPSLPFTNSDRLSARQNWAPAAGSLVSCNILTDKVLGTLSGTQLDALVNNACAALMPPCAYQDRLPPGTFCVQTIDFPLNGTKSTIQDATIQSKTGAVVGGWAPKFSVYPPFTPPNLPPVQWRKQDCVGYFTRILGAKYPQGCRVNDNGGAGIFIVGPGASLKGTIMEVTLVAKP